ncbi:MAG: hypothetical protein E7377_02160 [Clostridiales bacterium]|nr:hypothetical protein [Clostridiales bacterium]
MSERKQEERLGEALLKVALGYQVAEVTEEYAEVDGALKLMKRKKTKKDVPPDLKAVQILLSQNSEEYAQWSEEELEQEREKLMKLLEKGKEEKAVRTVRKTATKTRKASVRKKTVTKKADKEEKE